MYSPPSAFLTLKPDTPGLNNVIKRCLNEFLSLFTETRLVSVIDFHIFPTENKWENPDILFLPLQNIFFISFSLIRNSLSSKKLIKNESLNLVFSFVCVLVSQNKKNSGENHCSHGRRRDRQILNRQIDAKSSIYSTRFPS